MRRRFSGQEHGSFEVRRWWTGRCEVAQLGTKSGRFKTQRSIGSSNTIGSCGPLVKAALREPEKAAKIMKHRLFITLVPALLVLASFESLKRSCAISAVHNGPTRSTISTYQAEVTFDGIMIFQRHSDHYDVGILDKTTAPDHEFRIFVGDKSVEIKPDAAWSLNVENKAGQVVRDPHIDVVGPGNCDKLSQTTEHENPPHAYDFCWIIDLERDFHGGGKLKFANGVHLRPIIHLNNGELYTKYKYQPIEKLNDDTQASDKYGFVAETIGLIVTLNEDEDLVLRVKGTPGPQNEVFRLTKAAHDASVFNAPPCEPPMKKDTSGKTGPSHFHYYHGIFSNWTAQDAYDDVRNDKYNPAIPLNAYKHEPCVKVAKTPNEMRNRTYDHELCGTAFLGVSSGTLQ
jgi:hypothetical protein